MPVTVVRLNLVDPDATPESLSRRYRAAVEMAAYADEQGIDTVQTEEHHGAANGWLPSPLTFAGAVLGATRRIAVTVSALIAPLYDPLRSPRTSPCSTWSAAAAWSRWRASATGRGVRGARQGVEAARRAPGRGAGDAARGLDRRAVQVPGPHGTGHPAAVHPAAPAAAGRRQLQGRRPPRRPARAAVLPSAHLPELEAYYQARRAEYGTPGWCVMPAARTPCCNGRGPGQAERVWAAYGSICCTRRGCTTPGSRTGVCTPPSAPTPRTWRRCAARACTA